MGYGTCDSILTNGKILSFSIQECLDREFCLDLANTHIEKLHLFVVCPREGVDKQADNTFYDLFLPLHE